MSTELRDAMAEAICGATSAGKLFPWSTLDEKDRDMWRRMADAALSAVPDGYAVIKLPEPDEHGCWYIDGTNDWLVHTGANGTGVFFETSVDLYEFAPDHAGNLAAALLAAKAKAEASE